MASITVPVAIAGSALISGGLSAYGASQQAGAAKDAAQLQYQAALKGIDLQREMFGKIQGNLQPYMTVGSNALWNLGQLTGSAGSNDAQIAQLTQQLNALLGPGGTGGGGATAAPGSQTPGVQAALGTGAGGKPNPLLAGLSPVQPFGVLGSALGLGGGVEHGVGSFLTGGLFRHNNSALQDIRQALEAGQTVSDASWAEAGFGPNGAALGGQDGAPGAMLSPEDQAKVTQLQQQIADLRASGTPGNPLTAPLTAPFQPTMEQLSQTPGYKFALDQGLRAGQNRLTAQGLGNSGPAVAGAEEYATGLASETYQQQFQNYWLQNQAIYNMLSGLAGVGENAAAGVGNAGLQTTSNITNLLTGGASALGAGGVGAANAWAGAFNALGGGLGNSALLYALSQQGGGLFGGGGAAAAGGAYDPSTSWVYGGAAGFQPAGSWDPAGFAR